jgi:hypothetical protein
MNARTQSSFQPRTRIEASGGRSRVALHLWPTLLVGAAVLAFALSALPGVPRALAVVAQGAPSPSLAQGALDGLPDAPELSFADGQCDMSDDALASAQSLRNAAGLASDASTLSASLTDPKYHCTVFGVPMTVDELTEFARVIAAQSELSYIAEDVARDPGFGGAFFDAATLTIVSSDGRLGMAYAPRLGTIATMVGNYTHKGLQEIAKQLGLDRKAGKEYPFEVVRVEVNPRTNRVEVGVASGVDAAEDYFDALYGGRVAVVSEALEPMLTYCSTNDCGTKGGVAANHLDPLAGCTTGFLVQAHKGSGAWNRFMYTAGHCINGAGGIGNTNAWTNGAGNTTWGTNKASSYFLFDCGWWKKCRNGDQGLFALGGQAPANWNKYVIGSSSVEIDGYGWATVGQIVWRNGRTTGLRSGGVTQIPEYVAYSCLPWTCYDYGLAKVDVASDHGDSGSGFYRLYTSGGVTHRSAYGVLSGGPTANQSPTYYSEYFSSLDSSDGSSWHFVPCIAATCPLN